jgi:hypothetical protein
MVDGMMDRMMYRVVNRMMMTMMDNRMVYGVMNLGHGKAGHGNKYYGG